MRAGRVSQPALLERAAKGQIVLLHLREALPRYEMHLFAPARPRRALGPVIARFLEAVVR